MLKMKYVIKNLVENLLPQKAEGTTSGKTLIVNLEYSFSEWFEKPLSKDELKQLKKDFPNLEISKERIEAKIYANFMFINRGGYYSCFFNGTHHMPQWCIEKTVWKFTTNHDSCWRENAFSDAKQILGKIQRDISNISKTYKVEHVDIPKHVIPNFSHIRNSELFEFAECETCENHDHDKHEFVKTKVGYFLKALPNYQNT